MNYYGDKISENMALTPESFLICSNVPIGRTGWMRYLGQEIPSDFGEPIGVWVEVYRSPEELFSPNTIASFEGKSVTNTHPTSLLDINSAPMTERGHVQNVRRDGNFLVADLFIKDAGLVSEVQNKIKREVSSGYNCSWHKIGEGKYEQREITGNHVAVVPAGRAGSEVAIMDSLPGDSLEQQKTKTGGKKTMPAKITKKLLAAIGFKHYAQDAEPEDIAKAMDAMNEDDPEKKETKDADPEDKKDPVKDADPGQGAQLIDMMNKVLDRIEKLEKREEAQQGESADSVMDAMEKDLDKPAEDADPDPEKDKESAKDADPEKGPAKGAAADFVLRKFVQDMKPVIMAIPDEKARLKAAKSFRSAVQDQRAYRASSGYGAIIQAVASNKHAAIDAHVTQQQSVGERAEAAAKAWNTQGETMKGGK